MRLTRFPGYQVLIVFSSALLGIFLSVIFRIPLYLGFLPGFFLLIHFTFKRNLSLKEVWGMCLKGALKTKGVILILLLVSLLLPAWHLAGVIDELVSITISIMDTRYFFTLSFLAAMLFSMMLGTSVGTLSAIGIPLMATAGELDISLSMTAGALVSGAFVGDRTSPFSSANQLLSQTLEMNLKQQFKALLPTTIMGVILCLIFYSVLDLEWNSEHQLKDTILETGEYFYIKLIPPFVLIFLVLLRVSVIKAFLYSLIAAVFIALIDDVSAMNILSSFIYGVEGLRGGIVNMYGLLLFIALTGAFNGILEELQILYPYLERWLKEHSSLFQDTLKTMLATFIIVLVAANQTLPIILTGRSFFPFWKVRHSTEELGRTLADSTMLFPGVIPWSVLAIMCSSIVNVSMFNYLPFALFLWVMPILTILYSLAVPHIKKLKRFDQRSVTRGN